MVRASFNVVVAAVALLAAFHSASWAQAPPVTRSCVAGPCPGAGVEKEHRPTQAERDVDSGLRRGLLVQSFWGKLRPADGYRWAHPDQKNNYDVEPIPNYAQQQKRHAANAVNNRGVDAASRKRWTEAISFFKQALAESAGDAVFRTNLAQAQNQYAWALFKDGNMKDALSLFDQAVRNDPSSDPDNARIKGNLQWALQQAGEKERSGQDAKTLAQMRDLVANAKAVEASSPAMEFAARGKFGAEIQTAANSGETGDWLLPPDRSGQPGLQPQSPAAADAPPSPLRIGANLYLDAGTVDLREASTLTLDPRSVKSSPAAPAAPSGIPDSELKDLLNKLITQELLDDTTFAEELRRLPPDPKAESARASQQAEALKNIPHRPMPEVHAATPERFERYRREVQIAYDNYLDYVVQNEAPIVTVLQQEYLRSEMEGLRRQGLLKPTDTAETIAQRRNADPAFRSAYDAAKQRAGARVAAEIEAVEQKAYRRLADLVTAIMNSEQ